MPAHHKELGGVCSRFSLTSSEGTSPAHTCTSDFSLQKWQRIDFCGLSPQPVVFCYSCLGNWWKPHQKGGIKRNVDECVQHILVIWARGHCFSKRAFPFLGNRHHHRGEKKVSKSLGNGTSWSSSHTDQPAQAGTSLTQTWTASASPTLCYGPQSQWPKQSPETLIILPCVGLFLPISG